MPNEVTVQTNSLVPANIAQAMELAKMMADANLVPQHLQKKPADCLLVIEQAARWKMSPFAVAQCTSVIKGKLMYEGKLVAAVVNANGNLAERLSFDYSGAGNDRTIKVSGRFENEKQPRTVEVVFKDVKTDNSMWQKQPDQQLMYSGTRAWARRHAPELMLGVYSPEEFETQQMVDITPTNDQADAGVKVFKTAALRNQFHTNVKNSLRDALTVESLNEIITLNKAKFETMRDSGYEADAVSVDDLQQYYRVRMGELKAQDIPHEDSEEMIDAIRDGIPPTGLAAGEEVPGFFRRA